MSFYFGVMQPIIITILTSINIWQVMRLENRSYAQAINIALSIFGVFWMAKSVFHN